MKKLRKLFVKNATIYRRSSLRLLIPACFLIGLLLVIPEAVYAGFPFSIPSIPGVEVPVKVPGLDNLFKEKPAITTDFADTHNQIFLADKFTSAKYTRLTKLPRTPHGGFLLRPGFYELTVQSYCLHAGTHGPSRGEGYLNAPLKGAKKSIIRNILRNSVVYSQIPQSEIQTLIWAILAQTKINQLQPNIQQVARQLLTDEEIRQLNGGALSIIPPELFQQATAKLPASARRILDAENQLRQMLTQTPGTFQDLERIAVLVGDPTSNEAGPEIPRGRWSDHPGGYYVRYFPDSYSKTRIQLYVPQSFGNKANKSDAGQEYDPSGDVAVPSSTGRQRLAQSGRPADSGADADTSDSGTETPSSTTDTKNDSGYPSIFQIFCNPVVRAYMDGDWKSGLSDYKERSRWILWNKSTGKFSVTAATLGDSESVAQNKPVDSGDIYWVGYYHTHPPLEPGKPTDGYKVGPSPQDKFIASVNKIPSLVRDYTNESRTDVVDYMYGAESRGKDVTDPTASNVFPAAVCGGS